MKAKLHKSKNYHNYLLGYGRLTLNRSNPPPALVPFSPPMFILGLNSLLVHTPANSAPPSLPLLLGLVSADRPLTDALTSWAEEKARLSQCSSRAQTFIDIEELEIRLFATTVYVLDFYYQFCTSFIFDWLQGLHNVYPTMKVKRIYNNITHFNVRGSFMIQCMGGLTYLFTTSRL